MLIVSGSGRGTSRLLSLSLPLPLGAPHRCRSVQVPAASDPQGLQQAHGGLGKGGSGHPLSQVSIIRYGRQMWTDNKCGLWGTCYRILLQQVWNFRHIGTAMLIYVSSSSHSKHPAQPPASSYSRQSFPSRHRWQWRPTQRGVKDKDEDEDEDEEELTLKSKAIVLLSLTS